MFKPTEKQAAAIKTAKSGTSSILQACGGAGKTAVIVEHGKQTPNRKGYYFSFNREIVDSVRSKLPPSMTAYTIHGYAMGRKGRFYNTRLNRKFKLTSAQQATELCLDDIDLGEHHLSAAKCASMVMRGISSFCKSSDWKISGYHIPYVSGLSGEEMNYLRQSLNPAMEDAWRDIENTNGKLNFDFMHYVKLWCLDYKSTNIAADYVVIDESQDVMACVIPVLQRRAKAGKQLWIVGDDYQAINEWNGAEPLQPYFPDFPRDVLDDSFRFGQPVAEIANLHLAAMGADMRVNGLGTSTVGPIESPTAILCRTNAATIAEAIGQLALDRKVALLGNTSQFTEVADSALALMAGRPAEHYLFAAFETWDQVRVFANSGEVEADEIKTWVKLIDDYGAQEIKDMTKALVDKDYADVIVSTAHKTKGCEYSSVRVGGDFPSADEMTRPPTNADHMLNYVTVTRAMNALEPGNLAVAARSEDTSGI